MEVYDSAKVEAVKALRANFNATAIYEIGTVRFPGLSDLDLMMIVDSNTAVETNISDIADALPDSVKNVLAGSTVMVLNPDLFSTIRIWDDIRASTLWGQSLKLGPVSTDAQYLHLARAIDWIPERTLRVSQMMQMRSVKTSRAIGLIYSLCHSLRMILTEFNPTNAPEIKSYIAAVDDMRASWFQTDNQTIDQQLRDSMAAGVNIGRRLIQMLADRLSRLDVVDNGIEGELNLGNTGRLVFRNQAEQSNPATVQDSIILPTIFYEHFRNYALGEMMISKRIRASLSPTISPHNVDDSADSYIGLLRKRLDWIERQSELLTSLGLTSGLYKFGWYFSASTRGVE